MSLHNDTRELVEAGIIPQETADRIAAYYRSKAGAPANRLLVVFGILGALLVGLGIILIIAHNWDNISRPLKTGLALLPLLVGQVCCGIALFKKKGNTAWGESPAVFLFFAVGAAIALVSQIYNIPGDTADFIRGWMLLCLPLVYLMGSSMVSLLYLAGITYYAALSGYWSYPGQNAWHYWLLLAGILPYYYRLYKKQPLGNFVRAHHWVVPLSLLLALGTLARGTEELMLIAYMSLLGLFYILGHSAFFAEQNSRGNGYRVLGITGTMGLMLWLSFDFFWKDLYHTPFPVDKLLSAHEFYAAAITSLLAIAALLFQYRKKAPEQTWKPAEFLFLAFILVFLLGLVTSVSVLLINILILTVGIVTVRDGDREQRLGSMNFGLLIIAALVLCRFFDTNLSFVIRGILFVGVGIGFFIMNYRLLKKKKSNGH